MTAQSPYFILDTQEVKTTWHPVGAWRQSRMTKPEIRMNDEARMTNDVSSFVIRI